MNWDNSYLKAKKHKFNSFSKLDEAEPLPRTRLLFWPCGVERTLYMANFIPDLSSQSLVAGMVG